MKRLPSVSFEDLKTMTITKLLAIRETADEHFFSEMSKRTETMKRTGEIVSESIALQNAQHVQDLVQTEFARRAEIQRKEQEVQSRPGSSSKSRRKRSI